MTALFTYPQAAKFGRVLPKNKIYERAQPTPKVRQLFVDQLSKLVWQYKLATETVNLPATQAVTEIQVMALTLKEDSEHTEVHTEVLRCIDRAIPSPIVFEVYNADSVKVMAAYKRPHETDSNQWVVSDYFASAWLPHDTPREALPVVLNLAALYSHLLTPLLELPARPDESLQAHVERLDVIRGKQRELEKCESRLNKEKQFNRKVAINAERRVLMQTLKELTAA